MNQAELVIIDAQISHQVDLLRFTAGERKKVLAVLDQMTKELKVKLMGDLTDFGRARVNKLLKESQAIIDSYYGDMKGTLDVPDLAHTEVDATAKTIAAIGIDAAVPTAAVLKATVSETLLSGAPLKDWWAKQAEDVAFRYTSAVRQGIAQGETLQQIIVRVFGSKRLGTPGIGLDGVLRRNVSALVHDSIMSISGAASMEVYKENDDIIKGYWWLSTLDGIICRRCIARNGAQWDMNFKPIGEPKFPFVKQGDLHTNCRCKVMPLLKSFKEIGADIPEPPKGTRASDLGQIPADTTFDAFLKRHDKNYQDDLLGPGRADLWRKGKITLSDLVSGQGRELMIAELKARQ